MSVLNTKDTQDTKGTKHQEYQEHEEYREFHVISCHVISCLGAIFLENGTSVGQGGTEKDPKIKRNKKTALKNKREDEHVAFWSTFH